MEPTKRPWEYWEDQTVIVSAEGNQEIAIFADDFALKNAKANAELIVRAVNAHDKLVAACEAALSEYEPVSIGTFHSVEVKGQKSMDVVGMLKAALAEAKGGA